MQGFYLVCELAVAGTGCIRMFRHRNKKFKVTSVAHKCCYSDQYELIWMLSIVRVKRILETII